MNHRFDHQQHKKLSHISQISDKIVDYQYLKVAVERTASELVKPNFPILDAWLDGLKNIDLVSEFSADGIDNIQVEDGRIRIKLKE